ncbi:MAG: cytochrome c [Acidobacteriota bacterium]
MFKAPVAIILSLIPPVLLVPATGAVSRSANEGVYTAEQAKRGQGVYREECAKCHAENLSGGDGSPELAGQDFRARWNGKSAGDLFELIRKTMPTDDPGHLSIRQYVDLTAFLLSANEFPAGQKDLDRDVATLREIRLEPGAKPGK